MGKRGGRTRLISVVVCVALIALVLVALAGAASGQSYNEPRKPDVLPTVLRRPPLPELDTPTAQPETSGQLAFTGAHAVLTMLIGSGLTVVGLTVVRASRRRRTSQPQ